MPSLHQAQPIHLCGITAAVVCPENRVPFRQAAFRVYDKLEAYDEFEYGYTLKVRENKHADAAFFVLPPNVAGQNKNRLP